MNEKDSITENVNDSANRTPDLHWTTEVASTEDADHIVIFPLYSLNALPEYLPSEQVHQQTIDILLERITDSHNNRVSMTTHENSDFIMTTINITRVNQQNNDPLNSLWTPLIMNNTPSIDSFPITNRRWTYRQEEAESAPSFPPSFTLRNQNSDTYIIPEEIVDYVLRHSESPTNQDTPYPDSTSQNRTMIDVLQNALTNDILENPLDFSESSSSAPSISEIDQADLFFDPYTTSNRFLKSPSPISDPLAPSPPHLLPFFQYQPPTPDLPDSSPPLILPFFHIQDTTEDPSVDLLCEEILLSSDSDFEESILTCDEIMFDSDIEILED